MSAFQERYFDSFELTALYSVRGLGNSHITNYFICYGLLAVVLFAVGLPILLLYAAPALGEYLLARVPIPGIYVALSNPGNDTITFAVTSNIKVPDRINVRIEPMTVSFYQEGPDPGTSPFAVTNLPEIKWNSNQKVEVENQTLILQNITEFAKLVEQVAYYESFKVSGRTRAKIHVGPVNTWVNLHKTVTLTGFNNFTGFDIEQINLHKPDQDGYDVSGQVIVYNPAPAGVTLGNMTLSVLIGNVSIGEAAVTVENVIPGNNTFNVKGKLHVENLRDNIIPVIRAEMPYLRQQLLVASATGTSVVYEGQHLPYWEKAFQALDVTATKPAIPLIRNVVNGALKTLVGTDNVVGPVIDILLPYLFDAIQAVSEDDEEGFDQSVSSIADLALKILSNLGLV